MSQGALIVHWNVSRVIDHHLTAPYILSLEGPTKASVSAKKKKKDHVFMEGYEQRAQQFYSSCLFFKN